MSDNINLDQNRLADFALNEPTSISFFVERQFPAIYREEGRELIELVKAYYRFLESEEQSIYNARRIYDYRNIDTTLERMLLFFKNKFLNGLFFDKDIRFIVKNILALYRRKGSKEGIELFFNMFFEAEVSIYYPSKDMFKPSTSKWIVGKYLQLMPVSSSTQFGNIINKRIFGSISKASAFVDSFFIIKLNDALIPIIYISDTKGEFQAFDTIYSEEQKYGKVHGSLREVDLEGADLSTFSPNNRIGDNVEIYGENSYGAKGIVNNVITEDEITGELTIQLRDGDYGYSIDSEDSETVFILSEQTLFIENKTRDFVILETVKQTNSLGVEVFGTVVGQKTDSVGVKLDKEAPGYDPETHFFEREFNVETVERSDNISREVLFATNFNDTASIELESIDNKETVNIITDIIGDFLDVPLDSSNYSQIPPALNQMSGTIENGVEPNFSTPINEAFVPKEFEIGRIATLKNINPGSGYFNDVFILAKETIFSRFQLRDQILQVSSTDVLILEGDELVQQKQIVDFFGDTITKQVKGKVTKVIGDFVFVKQQTYEGFEQGIPVLKIGSTIPISISSTTRDPNSLPLGMNAIIIGSAEFVGGRITDIKVVDSGFGYRDGTPVTFRNTTLAEKNRVLLEELEVQLKEKQNLIEKIGENGSIESVEKRWNLTKIEEAIIEAGINTLSNERVLFASTIVPETTNPLADINQDTVFDFQDFNLFGEYAENFKDEDWRVTNSGIVNYIEMIMLPFMEQNYEIYFEYGYFPVAEFVAKEKKLRKLIEKDLETQINSIPIREIDGSGFAVSKREGITEGKWKSFESMTNRNKYIQDSFFYQDFSYEVSTEIPKNIFVDVYKDVIHPVGTKLFSKFEKTDRQDFNTRVISDLQPEILEEESNS